MMNLKEASIDELLRELRSRDTVVVTSWSVDDLCCEIENQADRMGYAIDNEAPLVEVALSALKSSSHRLEMAMTEASYEIVIDEATEIVDLLIQTDWAIRTAIDTIRTVATNALNEAIDPGGRALDVLVADTSRLLALAFQSGGRIDPMFAATPEVQDEVTLQVIGALTRAVDPAEPPTTKATIDVFVKGLLNPTNSEKEKK